MIILFYSHIPSHFTHHYIPKHIFGVGFFFLILKSSEGRLATTLVHFQESGIHKALGNDKQMVIRSFHMKNDSCTIILRNIC